MHSNPSRLTLDNLVFSLPDYMKGPKRKLLMDVAKHTAASPSKLDEMVGEGLIPVVDCGIPTRILVEKWASKKQPWIYRDRGYFGRGRYSASALPKRQDEGYWRYHLNEFQLGKIRPAKYSRFEAMKIRVRPWQQGGRHILICAGSNNYNQFHRTQGWVKWAIRKIQSVTDRPITVRHKDAKTPLNRALINAHCVVSHGSIAAVEAAILGVPVFVHSSSAAAHIGKTDLSEIETPIYPDRHDWLAALAASQVSEKEMRTGAAWDHLARWLLR